MGTNGGALAGNCASEPPITTLSLSSVSQPGLSLAVPNPAPDVNGWYTAPLYVDPTAVSSSGSRIQETDMTVSSPDIPSTQTYKFANSSSVASAPPVYTQLPVGLNSVSYHSWDIANNVEPWNYTSFKVAPEVSFIDTDTATQGNWENVYGSQGYIMAGDSFVSQPSYLTDSFTGDSLWDWNTDTSDVRAPEMFFSAPATDYPRIAATWYSATPFDISFSVTDGQHHKLSVYCLDWDSTVRNETLQLVDAATNNVLDTRTISSFNGGTWLSWTISSNVILQVINNNPNSNAVVSGLFFDPVPEGTPPTITVAQPVAGSTYTSFSYLFVPTVTPSVSTTSAVGISPSSITMTIDGNPAPLNVPYSLTSGPHTYYVTATDNWGVQNSASGTFYGLIPNPPPTKPATPPPPHEIN